MGRTFLVSGGRGKGGYANKLQKALFGRNIYTPRQLTSFSHQVGAIRDGPDTAFVGILVRRVNRFINEMKRSTDAGLHS